MTPAQFGKLLKDGPYAWPGGYPMFLCTTDGAALCFKCAKKEGKRITSSIRDNSRDGWQVDGRAINYEDPSLYCDHCGKRIESAYAEDEAAKVTELDRAAD